MGEVLPGRYPAEVGEDGVVVFLIGMRFDRWWRVDKWWPAFVAMPRMLRRLAADPAAGLLGFGLWPGRTVLVVQYWRNAQDLARFSSDPVAPHVAAWRAFNRRMGDDGSVGIWHESYVVPPGRAEAIYRNMPRGGLAAATGHAPVRAGRGSARARLAAAAVGASR